MARAGRSRALLANGDRVVVADRNAAAVARLGADPAGSAEQGLCPGLVSAAELFAPNVANLRSSTLL